MLMSLPIVKQAAVTLAESSELISSSFVFKLSATVFAAILPPGIINTVTGGRFLAQAFPDLNGLERFGLAGLGLAAAWFFLNLMLKSHNKALADKDAELTRLQQVVEKKDDRIKELEDKLSGK
jgi:hypothetical protein